MRDTEPHWVQRLPTWALCVVLVVGAVTIVTGLIYGLATRLENWPWALLSVTIVLFVSFLDHRRKRA